MQYENILSKDQKIQILNSRISQLVLEGYQNSVGLKVANKLNDPERVSQIQNILDIIEVSLEIHNEELQSLLKEDHSE